MAVLPAEIPTGLVTGQFYFVSEDNVDVDTDPTLMVVAGDVIFTCDATEPLRMPTKLATVVPLEFKAKFNAQGHLVSADDASIGIELPASDSPLFNPTGFTWTVTFDLVQLENRHTVNIEPFSFSVPEGEVTDLTLVMPVSTEPGVITIQGPQGIQGIQGIPGIADDASVAEQVISGPETVAALSAAILSEVAAPISAAVSPKLSTTDVTNSALLASGRTVVLPGDSITDGAGSTNTSVDSYRAYLGKIIGSARVKIVEHGVPGERSDQLLARVPAIIAENPAAAVIMIGTNDAGQSVPIATYKANVIAILDLFLAARIPVVLNLLPPRGAAASSPSELTRTYNLWLRHIAAQRGLPLADVYAALVDQATGLMQTAYDADGTHPTPAGHLKIAQTVAPVLQSVISAPLPWVVAPGAPGLIANPLMAGGGVSTPPTSWTSTGVTGGGTGTVGTVAADGILTAGSWMKLTADATAVGTTTTVGRYSAISPAPAPGDVILVAATVKQDVGSENAATVQFYDGTTSIANPIVSAGITSPGKILVAYTIPVGGYANPRIRCIASAAAGTVKTAYFGEVQVWNLTALGLTELAA